MTTTTAIRPLFLDRSEAARYLSISETVLKTLVQTGDAPKPRKLSANRCAWLVEELDTWGRNRPVSDIAPVANSGYGRAGKGSKAAQ